MFSKSKNNLGHHVEHSELFFWFFFLEYICQIAEDRTDVYTGSSSTQSTGSGSLDEHQFGDPSPSFFPIKPPPKMIDQFKSEKDLLATPSSPRKHGK